MPFATHFPSPSSFFSSSPIAPLPNKTPQHRQISPPKETSPPNHSSPPLPQPSSSWTPTPPNPSAAQSLWKPTSTGSGALPRLQPARGSAQWLPAREDRRHAPSTPQKSAPAPLPSNSSRPADEEAKMVAVECVPLEEKGEEQEAVEEGKGAEAKREVVLASSER
ncbi:hypothetical protein BDZ85DRAFT_282756 [Elsinoe ampelina]|uniref:Uncharacterized protein n=1 Tax=Elsinoe ampelina TaxID=302913 RepID=A0A6A6GAE6_9PEZI|nr:hypothetical protein BDZ85DRAFT_282756 [Elsinoe ampelina]